MVYIRNSYPSMPSLDTCSQTAIRTQTSMFSQDSRIWPQNFITFLSKLKKNPTKEYKYVQFCQHLLDLYNSDKPCRSGVRGIGRKAQYTWKNCNSMQSRVVMSHVWIKAKSVFPLYSQLWHQLSSLLKVILISEVISFNVWLELNFVWLDYILCFTCRCF